MTKRKPFRFWITSAVAASIVASGFVPAAQASPARPIGLNEAVPSLTEEVRSRRTVRARRNAAGAAIALGVLGLAAGAAIAAQNRRGYDYYEPEPYYYDPGPAYYAPSYGYYSAPGYYRERRVYRDRTPRHYEAQRAYPRHYRQRDPANRPGWHGGAYTLPNNPNARSTHGGGYGTEK